MTEKLTGGVFVNGTVIINWAAPGLTENTVRDFMYMKLLSIIITTGQL